MKRIAVTLCAALGLVMSSGQARASWCAQAHYSGWQPWYNICAKRYKCLTPEEERLQKFWHDYYNAMKNYYDALDNIDWVAYYKNHGYQINNGCGGNCGRINYAPVFVSPMMQWAVPQQALPGGPAPIMPAAYCAPGPIGPMAGGPMGGPMGPMGGPVGPVGPVAPYGPAGLPAGQ
jgi:hypothetical protein